MKYRVAIIRREYLNWECEEAVRVVVRACARPAERAHHAGGLPNEGAGGQVRLRRRAGVGARVGGDEPVQQGSEGAVRGVLRAC